MVDASQGIQAQTMAHLFAALEQDLTIIPVINKIDLPSAIPDETAEEIEELLGVPAEDIPLISAKNAINIEPILDQIVDQFPSPAGDVNGPLRAYGFFVLLTARSLFSCARFSDQRERTILLSER